MAQRRASECGMVAMSNVTDLLTHLRQKRIDQFYTKTGKCCAGCDHWQHVNTTTGDCMKSAPVPAGERWALVGLRFNTFVGAGHVVTPREHKCGDFADTFDWSSLPPIYLRDIGKML